MEYISTKEASAKWGISTTRITVLASDGRIPGARHVGRSWLIPAGAAKPKARKSGRRGPDVKKTDNYFFPLYHFRPDWINEKKSQLPEQQQRLFMAESAVWECRFKDAWTILETILHSPDDIFTEIGCLCNAGICCVALNKPKDFSKILLRLQKILSENFPHREDLMIILDFLKTYSNTISSTTDNYTHNLDVHYQSLPITCMMTGYVEGIRETMNPGSANVNLLELNLRFLETTCAVIVTGMMHCYLTCIYYMRHDMVAAEKHVKAVVQIAYENKLHFPLVTYYRYFAPVLSTALTRYPEEFQHHCQELVSQYEKNFTAFISSISEYNVFSKLGDEDYLYAFDVLSGSSNTSIAKKNGISPQTVKRKLEKIYEKLGVTTKNELIEYLHNYL